MLQPFMGIENWDRIGLSVEESTRRLQRIAFIDRQLMRIEAGHMIARYEYEVKGALARMVWQDACHYDQLRNRCKQLRMSPVAFEKCPDEDLQRLMTEALNSPNTLSLLTALFEVIKPAQIQAIQAYLDQAQPIVDEPTIHLLRHQLIDREEQITWGQEAIRVLSKTATREECLNFSQWRDYIQELLLAAGGIDGTGVKQEPDSRLFVDSTPFQLPEESTRDNRFKKTLIKYKDIEFDDSDADRFKAMQYARFFEMTAAEAVAYVHFVSVGKPWAFYFDTARHIWDEVRHSWFGEAALRKNGYNIYEVPNWTAWYDMTQKLFNVDETYTHLTIAIEKAAMKYPPGKRQEWEFCRDIVRDPLMTTFQDFDWADEVVHAGFGQKWIIDYLYNGDSTKAKQAGDLTWEKRNAFMAQYEESGEDNKPNHFAGGY